MEHPPGALRELKEVEALVLRAKAGEVVKIYPVSFGSAPVVPDLTPSRVMGLAREHGLLFEFDGSKRGEFDLTWRGIDNTDGHCGFLFTNYWLAYAFHLRHGKKK